MRRFVLIKDGLGVLKAPEVSILGAEEDKLLVLPALLGSSPTETLANQPTGTSNKDDLSY